MATYSQTELNAIRETVMAHQTTTSKLNEYAGRCQDEKVRRMFTSAAQESGKAAQKLVDML
ncbi:MAG: hypothetical protein LBK41_01960 [Clostridiales bacterium]|jgi:hypothetical protein|nr:hypothetical protein [Clostridiales bacterium]